MEHDTTVYEQEATALLEEEPSDGNSHAHSATPTSQDFEPEYALPVALLAALAMASTSATAYFAYATLLCKDPRHCESGETSRYAGFVAAATCIANILGISALGIYIALSGRIFEGFASDNLLHFILNAVYSQSRCKEKASSLISYSLAFYMIGISTSPFVAGLFQNFNVSFFIALALFAVSVSYIQLCMTRRGPRIKLRAVAAEGGEERYGTDTRADDVSPALGYADQAWQVYTITILLAVGLPTPSFIKGYFVNLHEGKERPEALAALAMMETLGSIPPAEILEESIRQLHGFRLGRVDKNHPVVCRLPLHARKEATRLQRCYQLVTHFPRPGLVMPSFKRPPRRGNKGEDGPAHTVVNQRNALATSWAYRGLTALRYA
ncbi:hypothetical protein DL766_006594 [Monosporascus sp. MC13-8B]|uniref:Uncharacterized protein n=1 Tax=Monosporascus cannonballus TaxID=155416 RepID=A0ABY0HEU0_9PEZI|nr:hypothetical protein DL763_008713 [Monosporascus cannonballus]RYO91837.1 hypothetical protein DL762_001917 [Monosporascus cannonballus]RYP26788.1 hypothetical protein DL766_006594 [Monosporascus sp. MC13-8B]